MTGCPDCAKRSLWAYRTYKVHMYIINMPKGYNSGLPFNFSLRAIFRYIAYKFVLGNMAGYWYKTILQEGKRIHDNSTSSAASPKVS